MKIQTIKSHLQPYSISKKRKTTINHAFASAIAPIDIYKENEKRIIEAMMFLGQDTENLKCVYCDRPAKTWDHVVGLVKNSDFSGSGHVIGNLLPCCKKCNSKKGNQNWKDFLNKKKDANTKKKIKILERYFKKYSFPNELENRFPSEMRRFKSIKKKILKLMEEADEIAEKIKRKSKK